MFGLMPFLLSYPVTRGLWRHGVGGLFLLAMFIAHHFLDLRWYKSLCKGKWSMARISGVAIDSMLLLAACATLASCALMAGEVFTFVPFPMPWWARPLHTAATAWLFVLIGLHAGAHWRGLWRLGSLLGGRYWNGAALCVCVGGLCCFIQSGIWRDMLLLDIARPETLGQFLYQYLGSAILFYLCPNLKWGQGKNRF